MSATDADRPEVETVNEQAAANSGRDGRGRFIAGNKGGPGNPFARATAEFRKAVIAAVTSEDFQAITRAMVEKARQGDTAAARLVYTYGIGRPAPAADPDTLDLAELKLTAQNHVGMEEFNRIIQLFPVDYIIGLVRTFIPLLADPKAAKFEAAYHQAEKDAEEKRREEEEEERQAAEEEREMLAEIARQSEERQRNGIPEPDPRQVQKERLAEARAALLRGLEADGCHKAVRELSEALEPQLAAPAEPSFGSDRVTARQTARDRFKDPASVLHRPSANGSNGGGHHGDGRQSA